MILSVMRTGKFSISGLLNSIFSIFVVTYPIINYYQGVVLSYGEWLFIVLFLFVLISNKNNRIIKLPRYYFWFWTYSAIALLLVGNFKFTYLIPGGVKLFLWSLMLGVSCKYVNIDKLYKYLTFIVVSGIVILLLQEIQYYALGSRFSAFLPLGKDLTYGVSYDELCNIQRYSDRSSSFFAEPAHFAIYILVLLTIELFAPKKREKLFSWLAFLMVVAIFLLRSGNGFVGLLILGILKVVDYYKVKGSKSILLLLVLFPIIYWGIGKYVSTEVGGSVFERTEELNYDEDARSYIRIYRGYLVYDALPLNTKILGTTVENLESMKLPILTTYGDRAHNQYFNGLQQVMIYQGIIGAILLLFVYIFMAKVGNKLSRMTLLLLLILSALGDMYLSPIMLLYTVVSYKNKNNEKT